MERDRETDTVGERDTEKRIYGETDTETEKRAYGRTDRWFELQRSQMISLCQ